MKKTFRHALLCFSFLLCSSFLIPTTAKANTTDDCLQMLSAFTGDSADKFIGLEDLNITDSQYETIRSFTLELTKDLTSDEDKITTIYRWVKDTSKKASVGEDAPADLGDNDPYKVFKEKSGICQGKANLCKTMFAALDIPCIISHGYWVSETKSEGHAWNYVLCDDTWGIVDGSMHEIALKEPSDISAHYKTDSLESTLYVENDLEFTYYFGGIGVVGYSGSEKRLVIPEKLQNMPVVSIAAGDQPYYEHSFSSTNIEELVLPASVQYGIYISDYETRSFTIDSLKSIVVDTNNPAFASYDGILYDKTFSKILSVPPAITEVQLKPMEIMEKNTLINLSKLKVLQIADGTLTIEEDALENCTALEKVCIPDSVTSIAYEKSNGNVYESFTNCASDFVVYASSGSAGAEYAAKKGLTLKSLDAFFQADYTKIDTLLKTVPSDLSLYTPDSVSRLNEAILAIDRNCTSSEQERVDQMAKNLEEALAQLFLRPSLPDISEPNKPDTEKPDTEKPDNGKPDNGKPDDSAGQNPGNNKPQTPDTTAPKPTAPKKITGLKISYKKSSAVLSWKKVAGANGYEIYRYQNKKWVKIKNLGKKTRFVIKKRSKKTVYYRVRAFQKSGKETAYGKYSKKIKCKAKK